MDRPGSAYNLAMLARIFIALCALPGCKKKLWRVLYDLLARSQRSDEWTFMNYGYAVADGDTLQLETADEPDRYCIQLYDHVAGAVNLQRQTVAEVGSGRGGGASYIKRYLGPGRVIGSRAWNSGLGMPNICRLRTVPWTRSSTLNRLTAIRHSIDSFQKSNACSGPEGTFYTRIFATVAV
jgi:hypothetical protein